MAAITKRPRTQPEANARRVLDQLGNAAGGKEKPQGRPRLETGRRNWRSNLPAGDVAVRTLRSAIDPQDCPAGVACRGARGRL